MPTSASQRRRYFGRRTRELPVARDDGGGRVCGGWQLARAALAAVGYSNDAFYQARITTAAFYAEQILPKAAALLTAVKSGGSFAQAMPVEEF